MPGVRAIFNKVLRQSNAGQTCLIERRAVRSSQSAASRGDRTHHSVILEGLEDVAQDLSRFGRAENRRTANTASAGINVEVAAKFLITGFGILKSAEMFLYVSLRNPEVPAPRRSRGPHEPYGVV